MGKKERRHRRRLAAKKGASADRPKPARKHSLLKTLIAVGLVLLIVWWYGGKLASDLRVYYSRLDAERKAKESWKAQLRTEADAERLRLREKEGIDGRTRTNSGEEHESSPD
jgi:hypothetical protein